MNIFFLDLDPEKAAKMHVNKHVIKMLVEHLQILCTAHHVSGSKNIEFKPPYKKTHINHPCNIWVRESLSNYLFLIKFTEELLKEYTYRYGKIHKCESYIRLMKDNLPNIKDIGFTKPAQAMPDKYKNPDNTVDAYRNYYFFDKQHIHSWKKRDIPEFIVKMEEIYECSKFIYL